MKRFLPILLAALLLLSACGEPEVRIEQRTPDPAPKTDPAPDAAPEPTAQLRLIETQTPAPEPTPTQPPAQTPAPVQTLTPASEPSAEPSVTRGAERSYVLNTNTMKFHFPDCTSVKDIKAENRRDVTMSRDEIIAEGYIPCKRCNP